MEWFHREKYLSDFEITPVTERFYRKIREKRLWVGRPLYGLGLDGKEKPLTPRRTLSVFWRWVEPAHGASIELVRLNGLHAIVDLVTVEVSNFLKERSEEDQMTICWMSHWRRCSEPIAPFVWKCRQPAVWLPFSQLLQPEGSEGNRKCGKGRPDAVLSRAAAVRWNCPKTEISMSVKSVRPLRQPFPFPHFLTTEEAWASSDRRCKNVDRIENSASREPVAPVQVVDSPRIRGEVQQD